MLTRSLTFKAFVLSVGFSLPSSVHAQDAPAPIERIFPPVGTKPDQEKSRHLRTSAQQLQDELDALGHKATNSKYYADVAIFPKAILYALDYDEFYNPRDLEGAEKLLEIGRERLNELKSQAHEPSWLKQHGLVVRGYVSKIDNSVQPYGLYIPENLDLNESHPLYIWLHGRQEKILDLQFVLERTKNKGKMAPDDAIMVYPFGRYNNAFKFAGEQDVIDVMYHVEQLYKTDPARRVLMGFSMGGAGCWQIGAHYSNLFCAMSPGAGFVESRKFLRIRDDNLPPWYEQVLWQWYDVPSCTQNLFNLPVIAYSGEKDRQKQAADVMEAEFKKYGRKMNHIIGPNMGHEYDDNSVRMIREQLRAITQSPNQPAEHRYIQSPLVSYASAKGISIGKQLKKWMPMELDAKLNATQTAVKLSSKNADALRIDYQHLFNTPASVNVKVKLSLGDTPFEAKSPIEVFHLDGSKWSQDSSEGGPQTASNVDRYEGSIDVAFCTPFLFVMPSGKSQDSKVQQWIKRESAYQIDRWRRTFRGDVPIVKDLDITPQQKISYNLILWGDADSNSLIREVVDKAKSRSEYGWSKVFEQKAQNQIVVGIGPKRLIGDEFVLGTVSQGGLSQGKWFVLNSGPTFRDDHDKNNANQVPKLPDWAILDVSALGDAKSPGRVVQAAFFGDSWEYEEPQTQQARFTEALKSMTP